MTAGATRSTGLTELIVALDFKNAEPARKLVKELKGLPVLYKVGLELFISSGPDFVRELVDQGNRVFLDLKLHDIPNTVAQAARQIAELKVEMFTLHIGGGRPMIEAVAKELAQIPAKRPKILGVTVLTSFDDKSWSEVNQACSDRPNTIIAESASRLMTAGTQWGVDGVVCSAHELKNFRTVNPYLYTVVPGIRPEGATSDDQARVMTPAQARVLGASAIVVGRPITLAASARQVGELILSDLRD